jgi:hypothetical protein
MTLEISVWTHHLNHLLYSYFYFCQKNNIKIRIVYNSKVKHNSALLSVKSVSILFDYSDDTKFIDSPKFYDFYFKRSFKCNANLPNVFPLNFNVPLSYNSISFLSKLKFSFLLDSRNRTEVVRALDKFSIITNSSHSIIDVANYSKNEDFGGNIIFYTRLWNPDNHPDEEEKERRRDQNDFRINACRLLKKEYKNAFVGLYADDLSKNIAPDLLLEASSSNKKKYFQLLKRCNIGVADDGLKDTPGWKIGEYLLSGKALVTTPLNIVLDDFREHINYESVSSRSSYLELPDKIEYLLKDKKYLEIGENNLKWSDEYIHPKNYINRILQLLKIDL